METQKDIFLRIPAFRRIIERGREEGLAEGRAEIRNEFQREIVQNMASKGVKLEVIADVLQLTIEETERYLNESANGDIK